MTRNASLILTLILTTLSGLATGCSACSREDPPPPLPSPPKPNPPAVEPVKLIDPPPEAPTADPNSKSKPKPFAGVSSLQKCCDAVAQNAKLAPAPNSAYFEQAASVCSAAVKAGRSDPSAFASVRAVLKAADIPAACR